MTLFSWLLVGHLVADWMLQNDWMARNKQSRWFSPAILVHCTVYTLILVISLWFAEPPDADLPRYLSFALLIFLSHWLIDAGRLAAHWVRLLRQTPLHFVQMMVDQTMHILVLVALIETLLAAG
jgi:hypothetical protein